MLERLLRAIIGKINNLALRARLLRLNARPRIRIKYARHISPTARFLTSGDDWGLSGSITIDEGCGISEGAIISTYGGKIDIGSQVFIGPYCVLYGHGGLRIGSNSLIAAQTVIIPANHIFADVNKPIWAQGETRMGITIEEDCWIGCGARILDGVTVGRGSVVGAGAVVSRSIPPYSVAVGSPARCIAKRGERRGESEITKGLCPDLKC